MILNTTWSGTMTVQVDESDLMVDRFGREIPCIPWQIELDVLVEEAQQKKRHEEMLCVSENLHTPLSSITRRNSHDVPHRSHGFDPGPNAAGGAHLDPFRTPPLGSLGRLDDHWHWETPEEIQIDLEVSRGESNWTLKGVQRAAWDPDLLVQWTAIYQRDSPLPTSVEITGRSASPNWLESSGEDDFWTTLHLKSYDEGQEGALNIPLARNPPPSLHAPSATGHWIDLLNVTDPYVKYPLGLAWTRANESPNGIASYLRDHSIVLPYKVKYSIYKESEISFSYEWNVTMCNASGSCASAVAGLSRMIGGIEREYVRYGEGHRWSGGEFAGPKFPLETQRRLLGALTGLETCLSAYSTRNPEVPIREMILTWHAKTGDIESARPGLEIDHGTLERTERLIESGYSTSGKFVVNSCDPDSGRLSLLQEVEGDLPPEWGRTMP